MKIFEYLGRRVLFLHLVISGYFEEGADLKSLFFEFKKAMLRSSPVVILMGFFIGGIMAIQIYLELKDFGALGYLGGISTSVTLRNVGPVFIAFILCGNVGAFTAAELATLRSTGQLEALECMGISALKTWVSPRLIAASLASAFLLILGLASTLGGGMIVGTWNLGIDPIRYLSNIPKMVTVGSIVMASVKSIVFGIVIGLVGCFEGYHAEAGPANVGGAVQRSTVSAVLSILFFNFMISSLLGSFLESEGIR